MFKREVLLVGDIGTGSVRAAFFDTKGELLAADVTPINVFHRMENNNSLYEQSTEEIWMAFVQSSRSAFQKASAATSTPLVVIGVCVDATCSLAFATSHGIPVGLSKISPDARFKQNVIMWLDHRAQEEHTLINKSGHNALLAYGGGLSIEMEPPKILWVKTNLPSIWNSVGIVLDLADFITFKLTGMSNIRSTCTMACKWAYSSESDNYHEDFWDLVGMSDVFIKFLMPSKVEHPGSSIKGNVATVLSDEFGLPCAETVGVSPGVVDAYAGALGCFATKVKLSASSPILPSLSLGAFISGTSTCLLIAVPNAKEDPPPSVPGIWGPFWNVLGNGLWIYEAGQSVAGKLLDWLFEFHPAGQESRFSDPGTRVKILFEHLKLMASNRNLTSIHLLTRDVHICPDFHGNRAPLARPDFKGILMGLDLDTSLDSLAVLYLSTVQSLAYNVKYIFQVFNSCGIVLPKAMIATGGLAHDSLYLQTHADVLNIPFAVSKCSEVVLLGCTILGANASQVYESVASATSAMSYDCETLFLPEGSNELMEFHEKKYLVYRKIMKHQEEILQIMK